jgi:integrase/recombinase XerD
MKKQKAYELDQTKIMSRAERKKLLNYCKEHAELDLTKARTTWPTRSLLVYLALYSGLRVGEMAALKIEDLRLKDTAPYIHVKHGKGDKSRKVYIPKGLVMLLSNYIQYKQKTLGLSVENDAPVFTSPKGGHVPPITLMKSFKAAAMKAGLRSDLSIHSCRHTYATFLYEETQDLGHVKKQLGHTNVSMTLRYADTLPERNNELVNLMSFED